MKKIWLLTNVPIGGLLRSPPESPIEVEDERAEQLIGEKVAVDNEDDQRHVLMPPTETAAGGETAAAETALDVETAAAETAAADTLELHDGLHADEASQA